MALSALFRFFLPGRSEIVSAAEKYAEIYGLDRNSVLAVIRCESGFREDALSPAGAVGLMQLMPETAKFIAEKAGIENYDIRSVDGNIRLGCAYMSYLKSCFSNEKTILAAYNAGEGKVREWLSNGELSSDGVTLKRIPYRETARYVFRVGMFEKLYKVAEVAIHAP